MVFFRVNNFRIKIIFPDSRAVFGFQAFLCNTRPNDFRKPIDINGMYTHALFYFLTHGVGPGLSAEDTYAQRAGFRISPLTFEFISQIEAIRRCDHDDIGLKILNQLYLFFGLTTRHGNDGTAQFFCTIMSAKTTGK